MDFVIQNSLITIVRVKRQIMQLEYDLGQTSLLLAIASKPLQVQPVELNNGKERTY